MELIEDLVTNLITLHFKSNGMEPPQFCVTVGFKDDVVIDDNTLIDNNIKMVSAGLKSKIAAIMEVQKCDEKTAQQELDRIAKEQSVTGLAVDDLMGTGEIDTGGQLGDTSTEAVIENAEDAAGKTLNGAQTQSLISIIAQYQSGSLNLGQAINIVSVSIGVSKDEAKRIIEGAE